MAQRYKFLLILICIFSILFYIYVLNCRIDKLKIEKETLLNANNSLQSNIQLLKNSIQQSNEEYKKGIDKCNELNKILQESAQQQKEQNNEVYQTNSDSLINLFNTRMLNIQNDS